MTEVIKALKREKTGKSAVRQYRRQGYVPGVYYSHGEEAIPLLFEEKMLRHFVGGSHALLDLQIEGTKKPLKCILKEIQQDPVSGKVLHVDFQGVKMGEKIVVTVPVVLTGTPAGVKEGGILEHMIRELEIECFPRDLPETLEIDVSNLKIGEAIHVKDLQFENIRILDEPDETILVIEAPRVAEEVVAEEEEVSEFAEPQEPEVIREKKETESSEE